MTSLALTPSTTLGRVTLALTGLPVFGAVYESPPNGDPAQFSNLGDADTVISAVQSGDPAVGLVTDARWTKGTTTFARVARTRATSVAVGDNFVVDVWISTVQNQPPVEVWLTTDDGNYVSEHIVHDKVETVLPVWKRHRLYFQADSADWQVRVVFKPLYPYDTSAWIMWHSWKVYRNDNAGGGTKRPFDDRMWIDRTDANGTHRLTLPAERLSETTGTLTVQDYEAALTGTVSYSVRDTYGDTTSGSTTLGAAATFLSSNEQGLSDTVALVTRYDGARASTGTVHQVIARTYPVVVTGPLASRQGTLDLFSTTRSDALSLLEILTPGQAVLLRQPDYADLDLRFVPTRVNESPAEVGEDLWMLSVDYVEVE